MTFINSEMTLYLDYAYMLKADVIPVMIIDKSSFKILSLNEMAAELFGSSKAELRFLDFLLLYDKDRRQELHSSLATFQVRMPAILGMWKNFVINGKIKSFDLQAAEALFKGIKIMALVIKPSNE